MGSMFANASNIVISDCTSTIFHGPPAGMHTLKKEANLNAIYKLYYESYEFYDPQTCHPGTRLAILERIIQWIFGSSDNEALILWLYGPTGAGKSTILHSIAQKCSALDILLASFIFSRSDDSRNHPGSLVATIAFQIASRLPQINQNLDDAIAVNPGIFGLPLDTQIELLIVGPMRDLVQSGFFADRMSSPCLILIDGLDQCNNEDRRHDVLSAIARAIRVHNLPFIFLISSRPESDIRFSFDSPDLAGLWDSLALDRSCRPNNDIRRYLNDSFSSIKKTHPQKEHIPSTWPTSSDVEALVKKSSGQFIYPSTVIKYISDIYASPPQQLDMILNVFLARSDVSIFAKIDALYMHILSSCHSTTLMLDILALLMKYFDFKATNSVFNIASFLDVDKEDVERVFSSLWSITDIHYYSSGRYDYWVEISHASFRDFLVDQKRSGHFHIDRTQYCARLAHKGIKWLCSQRRRNGNSRPPRSESTLNVLTVFYQVFASPRPVSISEDLYQDLESLPIESFWIQSQWYDWLHTYEWLLSKSKFLSAETATPMDPRLQRLHIKYAMRLKRLMANHCKSHGKVARHMMLLMETLAHSFLLNETRYDEALVQMLKNWAPMHYTGWFQQFSKDSLPYIVFKTIGLSAIEAGDNVYIHTALRILKSLATYPGPFQLRPVAHNQGVLHCGLKWLKSGNRQELAEFMRQRKKKNINSGKIYKIQRSLRLSKLQTGIRDRSTESTNCYKWNRVLVSTFLIPVLDQCPESDELLALYNRRIRHVCLRYTSRRRLVDAMDRYIRRTSDAGSN